MVMCSSVNYQKEHAMQSPEFKIKGLNHGSETTTCQVEIVETRP